MARQKKEKAVADPFASAMGSGPAWDGSGNPPGTPPAEPRAPAEPVADQEPEDTSGLIMMTKGDEVIYVHPTCVSDHQRLNWRVESE